ncbi:MAG: branched-chain amino acid ABC transporter permease [Spirochaetales bacterium]|nr:branched-chain amino acid ABC transporter permease [Spirochaetales bacterium]
MSLTLFYYLSITAIYILMSWALYLPYRVGQLHFMSVANMAISAYFAAIMAVNFSLPFGIVLIAGTIIGGIIGYIVSIAIGDAPCFSVVIVGFTFIYLINTIVENMEYLGGSMGIFNIPKVLKHSDSNRAFLLIIIYILVLFTGILINRFEKSKYGRAAFTINANKNIALSSGINIKKMGMLLQTWSSSIGGMCGVMYAFIMRSISPDNFTFNIVGVCVTMLFVGGINTMWGPLIAAPLLWGFPLILPEKLQSWKIVLYGIFLILILLIKPEGLITREWIKKIKNKYKRVIEPL